MSKRAIVIGCGKIGALYDSGVASISNHGRALQDSGKFDISFYDADPKVAEYAAELYSGVQVVEITKSSLEQFDWISLCTPTHTHFHYLEMISQLNSKTILCEKPVSYDSDEIIALSAIAADTKHTIFVNYFRRVLPGYRSLKSHYGDLMSLDKLLKCRIEYCRGFINNASHAFDLLEFIFDTVVELRDLKISKKEYDLFELDPTVSFSASWNDVVFEVSGENMDSAPIFNIYLTFEGGKVSLTESGSRIEVVQGTDPNSNTEVFDGCLHDYMKHSVGHAMALRSSQEPSNFTSSLALTSRMLSIIN